MMKENEKDPNNYSPAGSARMGHSESSSMLLVAGQDQDSGMSMIMSKYPTYMTQ